MKAKRKIFTGGKNPEKLNSWGKTEAKGPVFNNVLKEQIVHFIEYHPAKRFSKNLRSMLLEFLMTNNGVEAAYLNDLLHDIDGLFNLLEVIQSEEEMREINGGGVIRWKNQELLNAVAFSPLQTIKGSFSN